MWNIDYTDLKKLHMSIGIGLMVAGFLMFLTNTYFYYEKTSTIVDNFYDDINNNELTNSDTNIKYYQNLSNNMLTETYNLNKDIKIMSIVLVIWGFIVFIRGYIPFYKEEMKKKSKK